MHNTENVGCASSWPTGNDGLPRMPLPTPAAATPVDPIGYHAMLHGHVLPQYTTHFMHPQFYRQPASLPDSPSFGDLNPNMTRNSHSTASKSSYVPSPLGGSVPTPHMAPTFIHAARQGKKKLSSNGPKTPDLPPLGERTQEEALRDARKRGVLVDSDVPPGFPIGPFCVEACKDEQTPLQSEVNKWCKDCNTGGGGFKVVSAHPRRDKLSNKLVQCGFQCNSNSGQPHEKCKFNVRYQKCADDQWILTGYSPHKDPSGKVTKNGHSHPLEQSMVQMRAQHAGQTDIPGELQTLGDDMAGGGATAAEIQRVLRNKADMLNIDTTSWTYKAIHRRFVSTLQATPELDLEDLSHFLKKREAEEVLSYEIRTDRHGFTTAVFWQFQHSMEAWAVAKDDNVLLFDPTHGTNRHGMKLGAFVTVGPTGKNILLAAVLIMTEDAWHFEWSFRCFAKTFRVSPNILITDRDGEIEKAVTKLQNDGEVWEDVTHNFCVFHISVNLYKHIRPLFGSGDEAMAAWHTTHSMFWKIAKKTDAATAYMHYFESEWDKLIDHITSSCKPSAQLEHEISWLRDLGTKSTRWASRFVWRQLTYGIASTQRAESNQRSMKTVLAANTSAVALVQQLEIKNRESHDQGIIREEVARLRQLKQADATQGVVRFLQEKLTPFAFKLVLQQNALAVCYSATECSDDDDGHPFFHDENIPEYAARLMQYGVSHEKFDAKAIGVTYDTDGEPVYQTTSEDDGLLDTVRVHNTTTNWCSCQYTKAFGGLPCRHILYVLCVTQTKTYPIEIVAAKWLRRTPEASKSAVQQLYRTPAPSLPLSGAEDVTLGGGQITREERHRLLSYDFQALVTATLNLHVNDFEKVLSTFRDMISQVLASGGPPVTSFRPFPTAQPGPSVSKADQAKAQRAQEFARIAEWNKTNSHTDTQSLEHAIGMERSLSDELKNGVDLKRLLGKEIAFKFREKRNGGWMLGSVTRIFGEHDAPSKDIPGWYEKGQTPNVTVNFPADTDIPESSHCLTLDNMVTEATASIRSWGFVIRKGLSNNKNGPHRNPLKKPKRGRAQSKRLAPSHGPTSRKPKSKHTNEGAKECTGTPKKRQKRS